MTTDEIRAFLDGFGRPIPADAPEKLLAYSEELSTRGTQLGLISRSDAERVLVRHVLDSLRALRAVEASDRFAYDLGSGGGLPGVPVAISVPQLEVRLVETRRRRAAWLERVVEDLGLPNASVIAGSIEGLQEPADLCFARALGPLRRSWELAAPHLRPGGRLVYFAGAGFEERELSEIDGVGRILDESDQSGLESSGPLVIIAPQ